MARPIIAASGIASPQDIYDSSSDQEHSLGTRAFLDDGRAYYYAGAPSGTTLAVGLIHVASALVAHENLATATTSLVAGSNVVTAVTTGTVAITEGQYNDGYLAVTDGGGQGYIYRVKSIPAVAASAASGDITLYDTVAVASDAGTTVSLVKNLYDGPIVSVTDQADVVVGVPATTVAAGEFGWIQTWGPAAVLCDEAITAVGQCIVTGTGVAGAGEEDDTATTVSQEPIIGWNLTPFVDTEYQVVDLRIRP